MNVHSQRAVTKTVLITGATSGIGRATALHLASQGHRVFATGRNEAALQSLRLAAEPGSIETLTLDVTDRGQLADVLERVEALTDGKGIDVLVNNAGFGVFAPTSEVNETDLRAQYETNVFGLLAVTQAFVPLMHKAGSGTIINVSSVGGRLTLPFLGSYNSTKHAVESLSDALRMELKSFGIRVVVVEPGLINTNFTPRSTAEIERFRGDDSKYADALANIEPIIARTEAMGVPPERIAKTIARVVKSRRPRARYVAPFSAWLSLQLARVLPTSWLDALLWSATRFGGRSQKALQPASSSSPS